MDPPALQLQRNALLRKEGLTDTRRVRDGLVMMPNGVSRFVRWMPYPASCTSPNVEVIWILGSSRTRQCGSLNYKKQ